MPERKIICPGGCGSTSFRAVRRGALVEEFTVEDDGRIVRGDKLAEGDGKVSLVCSDCGRGWVSKRESVSDMALFLEER